MHNWEKYVPSGVYPCFLLLNFPLTFYKKKKQENKWVINGT